MTTRELTPYFEVQWTYFIHKQYYLHFLKIFLITVTSDTNESQVVWGYGVDKVGER